MPRVDFNNYFYYDETSPSCLRWRVVVTSAHGRPMTTVGSVAGSLTKGRRYFTVQLKDVKYACHRIIWEILKGEVLGDSILDHLDRNQSNNRINNLRIVTHKTNAENRVISSANKTGVTGVFLELGDYPRYVAIWKVDRKSKKKCFSISKYGLLPAFARAIAFRLKMIDELNTQGCNYTELHGKELDE